MPSGPRASAMFAPCAVAHPKVRNISRFADIDGNVTPAFSTNGTGCNGISAEVYRISGFRSVPTFSFEDVSICFLHKGTIAAEFDFGSISHKFSNGGHSIIPAGVPTTLTLSDADFTIIHLNPNRLAPEELDSVSRLELVPQIDPVDLQMTFLIGCIREELQSGLPGGRLFMETVGAAMTVHIFARYAVHPVHQTVVRGGLTSRQLRRAKDAMMDARNESVPLASLAQEAGLSPSYFCRAFKQSTGMSPHQWFRERRLERARKLLTDEQRSLTSIAIDLGFTSLSHFSAAFKQAMGVSPTFYRRSLMG